MPNALTYVVMSESLRVVADMVGIDQGCRASAASGFSDPSGAPKYAALGALTVRPRDGRPMRPHPANGKEELQ